MNRSLKARWSLLSGSGQVYLLWPSQASLYRRPIHQHPFFSLQQRLFYPSIQHKTFLSNNGALPSSVLCFCFVEFSLVLCCHSRGNPPILCLTPLDFLPPWESHAATRKGKDIDGCPISSAFLGTKCKDVAGHRISSAFPGDKMKRN